MPKGISLKTGKPFGGIKKAAGRPTVRDGVTAKPVTMRLWPDSVTQFYEKAEARGLTQAEAFDMAVTKF